MKRILCSILLCLTVLAAHSQTIQDNVVFNTTNQPATGFLSVASIYDRAQRFTTDSSADLTLRRIEFDMADTVYHFGNHVRVTIRPELNGYPNPSVSFGSLHTQIFGDGHYVLSGQIELQPNTTYWAHFDFLILQPNPQPMSFNLSSSPPGSGLGSWFGSGDDKSAWWIADTGPTFSGSWEHGYYPAVQMVISTVPEPSSFALFGIGTVALLYGREKARRLQPRLSKFLDLGSWF